MIIKIEILKLNTKTLSASGSTPVKILKQFVETYLPFLTNAIDLAISESEFLDTQINSYIENELSKDITDFHKSHQTQHSLLNVLEKWKK